MNLYIVESIYSSNLTAFHDKFKSFTCESSFYYEAIQLIFSTTGTFRLSVNGSMYPASYLYETNFYPTDPDENLLHKIFISSSPTETVFDIVVQANISYILIITILQPYETGEFRIVAYSSGTLVMRRINISNIIPSIQSTYASVLDENSQKLRPISFILDPIFSFYAAVSMSTATTGRFHIDINSTFETYMYLYENDFDPSDQEHNLIDSYDEDCENNHIQFIFSFLNNTTYILVITTSEENITGNFSITSQGPNKIIFTPKSNYFFQVILFPSKFT